MNITFYKVGGCVRDRLLGRKSKDIDFAVEAPSFSAMREALLARGVKIFQERPEFLTIRGTHPEFGGVDYVLTRKDGAYSDGRHPDSVEVGTILDDLSRRDFTMNAIAEREDGSLLDPFNGELDIKDRLIICVGNANDRFQEDKLRAYRALRFAVTLDFSMNMQVVDAIDNLEEADFDGVSVERIQVELWKAFQHHSLATFRWLERFPVLLTVATKKGLKLKPTLEQ